MGEQEQHINIIFPDALKGGAYTNNMIVRHTKEEFIIDFLFVAPPVGSVVARIITSPGHLKRIIRALQENLSKYEEKFGPIETSEEPKGDIGFRA